MRFFTTWEEKFLKGSEPIKKITPAAPWRQEFTEQRTSKQDTQLEITCNRGSRDNRLSLVAMEMDKSRRSRYVVAMECTGVPDVFNWNRRENMNWKSCLDMGIAMTWEEKVSGWREANLELSYKAQLEEPILSSCLTVVQLLDLTEP